MDFIEINAKSYFKFSGGEVHLKLDIHDILPLAYREEVALVLRDYSSDGIMALCHANEVLRRESKQNVHVIIPYLPYARQDRVMTPLEPFSLRTFASIINAQKFDSVKVYDPHSDVGPALIDRCTVIPQWEIAKKAVGQLLADPEVLVVSPDAGAYKKVAKLMPDDARIVIGTKVRNSEGKISRTDVIGMTSLAGKICLIVDDICDGGRTFIALAEELKKREAAKVILYVTHGIFSQGLGVLLDASRVDEIITTNTLIQESSVDEYFHTYDIKF